jgi:3-deoxy-D-manno-octulosonic-acid transferase
LIYRILFFLAMVVGSPYLLIKAIAGGHGIRERFGYIGSKKSGKRVFWFHAASVGELKIISSVIPAIANLNPNIEFAVSTTTVTGRNRGRELFGDRASVFLQPLEMKSAVERVLSRLEPEKLIVVETEVWPLMLSLAADRGVELYLINARMKDSSYKKYRMAGFLFSPILRRFAGVLARTSVDAERFRMLGAANVEVAGNLKYDQALSSVASEKLSTPVAVSDPDRLSIRRGEDEILADVIKRTRLSGLPVVFILAPRHMDEVDDINAVFAAAGIECRLRSETNEIDSDTVMLVNTMGELTGFYGMADLAFVGGSMVPIGGHDPLEPAALGKPVIFGRHMDNAGEAAEMLLESGGAFEADGASQLYNIIENASRDRSSIEVMGDKCRQAILSMTGGSKKVAEILVGDSS